MYALSFLLSCSCSLYETTTSRCVQDARCWVHELCLGLVKNGNFFGQRGFSDEETAVGQHS